MHFQISNWMVNWEFKITFNYGWKKTTDRWRFPMQFHKVLIILTSISCEIMTHIYFKYYIFMKFKRVEQNFNRKSLSKVVKVKWVFSATDLQSLTQYKCYEHILASVQENLWHPSLASKMWSIYVEISNLKEFNYTM